MQHTKSKKGKRLLGVVISCAMLFGMFPGMSVSAAEPETETINLLDYYTSAITTEKDLSCGITVKLGGGGSMTYTSTVKLGGGGSMTYTSTWSGNTTRQFSVPRDTSSTAPATFEFSITPDGPLDGYEIISIDIGIGTASNVNKTGDFGTGAVANSTLSWLGNDDSVTLELYRNGGYDGNKTATINSFRW